MTTVKLQHQRNRGPNESVIVNGNEYELDETGTIECTAEDAEKLRGGKKWRTPEFWEKHGSLLAKHTPPSATKAGGRRVRTRDELLATADAEGIPVEHVKDATATDLAEAAAPSSAVLKDGDLEVAQAVAKAQAHADAELVGHETITVTDDMSKSELTKLAIDVGLKIPKGATKAQILDLFPSE